MSKVWTLDPTEFADKVVHDHAQLCAAVALAVDAGVVRGNPVKSGRCRANWLPSVGSPRTETVEIRSDQETIVEAQQVFGQRIEFPVYYVANNLPYVQLLENGNSKQAPSGFVATAIAAVVERVKRGKTVDDLNVLLP